MWLMSGALTPPIPRLHAPRTAPAQYPFPPLCGTPSNPSSRVALKIGSAFAIMPLRKGVLCGGAGATPADAAAGHTAPEAIVAPASSIGCSGAGKWQLNSTCILCPHKYTQKDTDFSALLLQKVGIG